MSYFELLGLPVGFEVDAVALERAWRDVQAQVHPDRHVTGTDLQRRLALQRATEINQAVQTLRDPLKRAVYLCELHGHPVDAERNTAMPTAFLMEQMELREALDDGRMGKNVDALDQLSDQLLAMRKQRLTRLAALIDQQRDWPAAVMVARELMFFDKLRDETNAALEALDA